jgi:Flp pilus assembly protein TadG
MAFLKRLRTLGRDQSGNALAICAAALPLVIGGAGLAIDSVQISVARRELQRAADSAALAGAYAINQNPTSTGTTRSTYAQNGAVRDLEVNNDVTLTGSPVVQNAPATGPFASNADAVRVQLTANRSLSFLAFFDATPTAITVEATAAIVREGNFCMLALEDSADTGVTIGGNATINIGCGISTNSRHPTQAIYSFGSSSVTASPIMAVGGVSTSTNYASGTSLIPYAAVQQDPYSTLPVPAITPSQCTNTPRVQPNDPPRTIAAGCHNGLDIDGTATLAPGVHYINGDSGDLSIGAQANLSGTGVTIVLTSTDPSDADTIAGMTMNGNPRVNLSAPDSGPYTGVLFYQDPRAERGNTVHFNGGATSVINGAFYFPQANFFFNGTAGMATSCIQLVARRLDFSGNGTITNTCSPTTPGSRNFQATYVRLVG